MREEWAKDLVAWSWCISQVVKAHKSCPKFQAALDEYHKPVIIRGEIPGELKLDKDYDTFEDEIQWCGTDVSLSLEVNAESKPSRTRVYSVAKKLLVDCNTWDKTMRGPAVKSLTRLVSNWFSQDEGNPRNPETDPIVEERLVRWISMTSLSVISGDSFTAWFSCDGVSIDRVATVYGSLKKGLRIASTEGQELPMEKATAVNICSGALRGWDHIYLDQVKQDGLNNLTSMEDINGHLVSQYRDEKDWLPHTLTFRRALAYFSRELDTYRNMAGAEYTTGSSFDLIEDSTWLRFLLVWEGFDKSTYQHYRLSAHDDVYDITAASHELVAKLQMSEVR